MRPERAANNEGLGGDLVSRPLVVVGAEVRAVVPRGGDRRVRPGRVFRQSANQVEGRPFQVMTAAVINRPTPRFQLAVPQKTLLEFLPLLE